jgi:hypothetical protein
MVVATASVQDSVKAMASVGMATVTTAFGVNTYQ